MDVKRQVVGSSREESKAEKGQEVSGAAWGTSGQSVCSTLGKMLWGQGLQLHRCARPSALSVQGGPGAGLQALWGHFTLGKKEEATGGCEQRSDELAQGHSECRVEARTW